MAHHNSARSHPHVVIIGGGFGGLSAARAMKRAKVRLTLIDRRNHHQKAPGGSVLQGGDG
jgi:NADH dehydrogenase